MELTRQDKKHIDERVRQLSFRIVEDAQEYMKLYDRTYYEKVIDMCEQEIETIDALSELSKKIQREMRLRQAKKIMEWCKGNGDYYTINRHKDQRESFWIKMQKLRPGYYDDRGVWVQPSCNDIDVIRRAHTRLFRYTRKVNKLKERDNDRQFENKL